LNNALFSNWRDDMLLLIPVCFVLLQSEKGGATSMANPLYQDPYLEEDLTKY